MRRSARLVHRRFWNVLGAALLGFLVELLFESAIGLLPTFVSFFVGTEGIAWVLPAVVGVVTQLVTMPFVARVTVLIYLDLRVRTEGLDLELRAGEAFPAHLMGLPPSEHDPGVGPRPRRPDPQPGALRRARPSPSPSGSWSWLGEQLTRLLEALAGGGGGAGGGVGDPARRGRGRRLPARALRPHHPPGRRRPIPSPR